MIINTLKTIELWSFQLLIRINDKKFVECKFSWQEGYGAFSYAHSQIEQVYNYILNQELHHHKKTFKEEYLDFLQKFELEYDEKYVFEWINE